MFGNLALVEDRGAHRIDACGDVGGGDLAGRAHQIFGFGGIPGFLGDGVHVHHAEQAGHFLLHPHHSS